jgi:NAD(P)-dependent dehydrogenase (short-subunit alcohol dehydrogenase family)
MTQGNNKVAIITGASRGIGAAIAQRLAHDGFTVVLNYAGKASEAEALTAKIEKDGGRAIVGLRPKEFPRWPIPPGSIPAERTHQFANQIANQPRGIGRHQGSQCHTVTAKLANWSARLATVRYAPARES